MSLSVYEVSGPAFVRMLNGLSGVLDKGIAHAKARNSDPASLLGLRLHPTMWNLEQQVKVACAFSVDASARLTGAATPQFTGPESGLDGLKARIAFALAYVEGLRAADFEGGEAREVQFLRGDELHRASGRNYLLDFVLPNFYFHLTAVYAILRLHGVALGKEDYGRGISF